MEQKKTISAVIAEFNPFHNGHKLLLEEAKKISDYTIVILSGDFVQRGEPAIFNKYVRTHMALLNGADLVIELPVLYALSSAEGFARGSIDILNTLGCVDTLIFGSENGDIDALLKVSTLLCQKSDDIDNKIKELLKNGYSYPTALQNAYKDNDIKDYLNIISSPNNILALEYIKALIATNSLIKPQTIKRCDNGYNNEIIDSSSIYNSASSIRLALKQNSDSIVDTIPENISKLFIDNPIMDIDNLSDILYYQLLNYKEKGYTEFLDVSDELSHKIIKNLHLYKDVKSFIDILKSKNMTYSRISRSLMHILLEIKKEDVNTSPLDLYARILGFNNNSKELLSIIKKTSSIPMISKLKDAKETPLLKMDIKVATLYEQINKTYLNEYQQSPVVSVTN